LQTGILSLSIETQFGTSFYIEMLLVIFNNLKLAIFNPNPNPNSIILINFQKYASLTAIIVDDRTNSM